jgi:hypothetical protein
MAEKVTPLPPRSLPAVPAREQPPQAAAAAKITCSFVEFSALEITLLSLHPPKTGSRKRSQPSA